MDHDAQLFRLFRRFRIRDQLSKGRDPGPNGRRVTKATEITITARGMALLAKCGQLPDVEEEEIEDKSKGQ